MIHHWALAGLIVILPASRATAQTFALYDDPLPAGAGARLGTQAFRDGGSFQFLTFTPDGKSLITGSGSMVRQWDAVTGKELRWAGLPNFAGMEQFWCCGLSKDGKRMLFYVRQRTGDSSGSFTPSLRVWDLAGWTEINRFPPKHNPVQRSYSGQFALSPDGDHLIEKAYDGVLWHLDAAAKKVNPPIGGGAKFSAYAFHPNGKHLVTGDENHTIQIWELATGNELRSFGMVADPVGKMAMSPDGQWLATLGRSEKVTLWDVPGEKMVRELPLADNHGVVLLAFMPDSRMVLTVGVSYQKTTVKTWEVTTGKEVRSWPIDAAWIDAIALSPDGTTLVTGSRSGILCLWDVATGRERFSHVGHLDCIHSLDFANDGRSLRSAGEDGQYLEWDLATRQIKRRINTADNPVSFFYLAADRRLFATHSFNNGKTAMQVRDAATAKVLHNIDGHMARGFLTDGTLVSHGDDQKIHLWDAVTAMRRASFDVGFKRGFIMPLGGARLVAVEKETAVWDTATGRRLFAWGLIDKRVIERHDIGRDDEVRQAALSSDGKLIAFSVWRLPSRSEPDHRGKIVCCELESGDVLHAWSTGAEHAEAVAFSPDSKVLAATAERSIRIWDVATGKVRHTYRVPRGGITTLAYSNDGVKLASGGSDGVIYVWDLSQRP